MKSTTLFLLYPHLILLLMQTAPLASLSHKPKQPKRGLDCSSRLHRMEKSIGKISIALDNDARPFTSVQDFSKNYCSPYPQWVKWMQDYRPCLKPFARQVLTMMCSSLKRGGKQFCATDERKETVVRHSLCFNNQTLPAVQQAMKKAVVAIDFVADEVSDKELIPGLCCAYQEMLFQGEHDINAICRNISGPGTAKFLMDGIVTASNDVMELLCGQYVSKVSCEEKAPVLMKRLKHAISRNEPKNGVTPILSLLNFVQKFDTVINVQ